MGEKVADDPDIDYELVRIDYGLAPFRSDRHFQVWKFHVSKRGLLLRSPATSEFRSLIDVHFGGVSLMVLRDSYDGLEIREGLPDEVAEIEDRYETKIGAGGRLNILGGNLTSFVVSGIMQWREDSEPNFELDVFGLG